MRAREHAAGTVDGMTDASRRTLRLNTSEPLQTRDEQAALAADISAGRAAAARIAELGEAHPEARMLRHTVRRGQSARNTLIEQNLKLAYSVAKRYRVAGVELEDLVQEATFGMAKAANVYDPARGAFSTVATMYIRQHLLRTIDGLKDGIRLPADVGARRHKALQLLPQLEASLDRAPTTDELAAAVGCTVSELDTALGAPVSENTLDGFAGGEDEGGMLGLIEDENATADMAGALGSELFAGLDLLEEKERAVLVRRFGLDGAGPRPYSKVASELGMVRNTAIAVEARALSKLRHPATAVIA